MGKVNRFLARVAIDGREHGAHIPNSGRLAELMAPGLEVTLEPSTNPLRKTAYTLKSVRLGGKWVCVDSTIPNALAQKMAMDRAFPMFAGYDSARREVTIGGHRFDLRLDGPGKRSMIVEVKSVTLVRDGVAMFPDAPTIRGASHLRALAAMNGDELRRLVVFVVQRSDARRFRPNAGTDPDFAQALKEAAQAGVDILAVKCAVGASSISVCGSLDVELVEFNGLICQKSESEA